MTRTPGISGSLGTGDQLLVSRAGRVFADGVALADDKSGNQLAGFMQGFVAFLASTRD